MFFGWKNVMCLLLPYEESTFALLSFHFKYHYVFDFDGLERSANPRNSGQDLVRLPLLMLPLLVDSMH